jgi:hypothetical protein
MTSKINTTGINTSFPTPGINNTSQGFRDNFSNIQNNLTTAGTEITDLQNKVIVKSALTGVALNNNMANTLISNAAVQGFRNTTYNLGDNLSGSVAIDVAKGDVLYGAIVADATLNFGDWAPSGTKSSVELRLYISNTSAKINFPNTSLDVNGMVVSGMTNTVRLLENYDSNRAPEASKSHTNVVSVPAGVIEMSYTISTIDCGTTLDIQPTNRNQIASSIEIRTPTSTGMRGDYPGRICVGAVTPGSPYTPPLYLCVGAYDGTTAIWGQIPLTAV